jgi:uncharacterized membrane protein YkoI
LRQVHPSRVPRLTPALIQEDGMTELRRTLTALALAGTLGAGLVGCSGDDPEPTDPPAAVEVPPSEQPGDEGTDDTDPESEPTSTSTDTPSEVGEVDLISVVQAAQEAQPGTVVSVDWEDDDGREGWEVLVNASGSGVELLLDPTTLAELDRRQERLDSEERHDPEVLPEEAVSIAGAAVPGIVEAFSLSRERGRAVWDLDVRGDGGVLWEVYVDATSGEVIKKERDD